MKAGLFIAALAQLAAAQPQHRFRHQHLHEKRDVVTEIQVVTATAPDAVVFVNQFGEPVTTSFVNQYVQQKWHSSTPVSSPAAATPTYYPVETSAAATSTAAPVEASSAAPVAASSSKTASSAAAATSSASSGVSSYGLTYSPYTSSGNCKTLAQVQSDFQQLGSYGTVRLYGVDCNQLNTVGATAISKGMKLFLGVYDISNVAGAIGQIITFAAGNWDNIETVSVGNELVNSGQASVATVVAAVQTARALLTAAGFKGNVVTVDTYVAVLNNPELCHCSDFAAINTHAFFNPQTTADRAGTYVYNIQQKVQQVCGKTAIVTESGWPSQGQANGVAVPGAANQATAVSSLKSAFASSPSNLILFTAYNDFWKKNFAGSFEAEQYWGILGTSASN